METRADHEVLAVYESTLRNEAWLWERGESSGLEMRGESSGWEM
jgi:hypothetical protein